MASAALPGVSIVVCTRNRAPSLALTLEAIARLDRGGLEAIELIVVDNGSTDGTARLLAEAQAGYPFPLRVARQERRGLARARNLGLSRAGNALILMTDDDCQPFPDWARATASAYGGDLLQVIGGAAHDAPDTIPDSERAFLVERTSSSLTRNHDLFGFIIGANLSFGRVVHERIGGFDVRLGAGTRLRSSEDADFVYRAFLDGIPVRYEAASQVLHDHRRTVADQVRMRFGYTMGDAAVALKHARRDGGLLLKSLYWGFFGEVRGWRMKRWPLRRPAQYPLAFLRGAADMAFQSVFVPARD
ncbi:MAG: glycosyltransferase family 2 protein [Acetobacteraceae bacterium]